MLLLETCLQKLNDSQKLGESLRKSIYQKPIGIVPTTLLHFKLCHQRNERSNYNLQKQIFENKTF